jgi:hypothetical protein
MPITARIEIEPCNVFLQRQNKKRQLELRIGIFFDKKVPFLPAGTNLPLLHSRQKLSNLMGRTWVRPSRLEPGYLMEPVLNCFRREAAAAGRAAPPHSFAIRRRFQISLNF